MYGSGVVVVVEVEDGIVVDEDEGREMMLVLNVEIVAILEVDDGLVLELELELELVGGVLVVLLRIVTVVVVLVILLLVDGEEVEIDEVDDPMMVVLLVDDFWLPVVPMLEVGDGPGIVDVENDVLLVLENLEVVDELVLPPDVARLLPKLVLANEVVCGGRILVEVELEDEEQTTLALGLEVVELDFEDGDE